MHSYLDDSVYPPHQTVIVRCEDFLFSYLAGWKLHVWICAVLVSWMFSQFSFRVVVPWPVKHSPVDGWNLSHRGCKAWVHPPSLLADISRMKKILVDPCYVPFISFYGSVWWCSCLKLYSRCCLLMFFVHRFVCFCFRSSCLLLHKPTVVVNRF